MSRSIRTIGRSARIVALVAFADLLVSPGRPSACSIFSFLGDDGTVYGQNLDWRDPVPGLVVVNTRGVAKHVLPWRGHWPSPSAAEPVTWVSRYGSVTFTCLGRDFIDGGMNEAGLTVDETNLTAAYPPDDGRPGVSCTQWMQYQLDNFASVDEVIAHLDDLRPDGEGWHYLVADSSGACAVIEYLTGEALVYSGDQIEVCALTNTTYRQAMSHIPLDAAFGGDIDIALGKDSYARFVRMAALIRDYDPGSDGDAVDHAFRILDAVSVEETRRSVVYDAGRRRVLWRTGNNPRRRWLELERLDFFPDAPIRILDVDAGPAGDVSNLLTDYTPEANRAVVVSILAPHSPSPETIRELARRGLTIGDAVELIATHPTRKTAVAGDR